MNNDELLELKKEYIEKNRYLMTARDDSFDCSVSLPDSLREYVAVLEPVWQVIFDNVYEAATVFLQMAWTLLHFRDEQVVSAADLNVIECSLYYSEQAKQNLFAEMEYVTHLVEKELDPEKRPDLNTAWAHIQAHITFMTADVSLTASLLRSRYGELFAA